MNWDRVNQENYARRGYSAPREPERPQKVGSRRTRKKTPKGYPTRLLINPKPIRQNLEVEAKRLNMSMGTLVQLRRQAKAAGWPMEDIVAGRAFTAKGKLLPRPQSSAGAHSAVADLPAQAHAAEKRAHAAWFMALSASDAWRLAALYQRSVKKPITDWFPISTGSVEPADVVFIVIPPEPRDVWRPGLWAVGEVLCQPDGGARYADTDPADRRRRCDFIAVNFRFVQVIDWPSLPFEGSGETTMAQRELRSMGLAERAATLDILRSMNPTRAVHQLLARLDW